SAPALPTGSAAAVGAHDLPEKRVVPMATAIVANSSANRLRNCFDAAHQLIERFIRELRRLLDCRVQVVDVRLMMLAVVNLHRHRVDVRPESIGPVRKIGKCKCHCCSSLISSP